MLNLSLSMQVREELLPMRNQAEEKIEIGGKKKKKKVGGKRTAEMRDLCPLFKSCMDNHMQR